MSEPLPDIPTIGQILTVLRSEALPHPGPATREDLWQAVDATDQLFRHLSARIDDLHRRLRRLETARNAEPLY